MAYHARVLDGRSVFVTHAGTSLGQHLATALTDLGARVRTGMHASTDRATAVAALADGAPLDVLVHVVVDDAALIDGALADVTPEGWDSRGEALLRDAVFTFGAAHDRFATAGTGRIVVVAPTSGVTGAAGFVPYATAVEGVRGLAKSAARQWGPERITVNMVLVAPALVAPALSTATSFEVPPAVGRLPGIDDDVATTVAHLASSTSSGITGATVVVDGGSVMAP
jgi:3-oxoacyl-[acyl-carrier protein] reductase